MLTKKIAIAAGALTLAAGGVAAAVSPPEAADDGLSTAEEQVGVELPASKDARPGATPEVPDDEELEEPAVEGSEQEEPALEEAGPPEGTHGAEVSAVARSDEHEGRARGEAVSAAARDNHGAEASAQARADDDEDHDEDDDDLEAGDEAAPAVEGRP